MGWNDGGRKYLKFKAEASISEEVVDSEPIFESEDSEINMTFINCLVLALLVIYINYSAGLSVGLKSRLTISSRGGRGLPTQSTAIMLDPALMDTMTNTAEITTNTFFTSILARTIGTVAGNLLAAFAFKYASDFFFQKKEAEAVVAAPMAAEISQSAWIKLIFCIMIDLASDASFLLPGIGEIEDLAWAPVSAYLLNFLFGSNVVSTLEFAKEILPGTDILPIATLAWVLQNVFVDSPITSALGLKKKIDESVDGQSKDQAGGKLESMSPEMDAWDNKLNSKK